MNHIYRCQNCGKYTMRETCSCGAKTLVARPMKYVVKDKFAEYRRKAKIESYKARGLL